MEIKVLAMAALVAASPAAAQEQRQLEAHEHGVGHLNIAFEGDSIAIELRAPGADIVGFEHAAASAEDRAAVADAVATLARPLDLFILPEAAGCSVAEAGAELVAGEHHDDDEDHADHADHEEGHEDHAEGEDHDEHGAEHAEFHAEYVLHCATPGAIDRIEFAYFETFPNARELEVQMISDSGAHAFEVERDAPVLDLAGRI